MGTHRIALTEAKQSLGQLANRAAYGGDRFVLEFRGKPRAALVSFEDLERLEAMDRSSRSQREVLESLAGCGKRARRTDVVGGASSSPTISVIS